MLNALRSMKPFFVEEPVNADNPRTLLELRKANPYVRIAAGERLMSRWAFREWLEIGAIDVAQPDTSYACGISEVLKIARYAEVYNVTIALHNSCGPVATAAASHAAAAMANFLILEHCRLPPWTSRVQKYGPLIKSGCIELDDRPGLGIELDFEVVHSHPYRPLPLTERQARYRNRWGSHALI
jgi:galactonate dehydratase